MTRKEQIISMIERMLPDDVTYDRVIYHLEVMRSIEVGLEQAERGEFIPHEEVFAELLPDDAKEKARLDGSGKRAAQSNRKAHRARSTPNGGSRPSPSKKQGRRA